MLALALTTLEPAPAQALLWPSEIQRIERDLQASDVGVRRRAARRVRELPADLGGRVALRALEDPDLRVRLSALEAATTLGAPGLSERVIGWLTQSDPRLRLAAAEALAVQPVPRAVGPLSRALADVEPSVRAAAAGALGSSGASEAVIGLLGRLDDSAIEVRESVIRALARLGDARAVVPLISKIEDPRPEIRRTVARALGELGDRRAVSALVLALRDAEATVRVRALEALGELGDPAVVPSVSAVLADDPAANVRLAAIDALGRIGTPEAIGKLLDTLGRNPEEQDAVVRALARIGAPASAALSNCVVAREGRERANGCALALALTHAPGAGAAILEAARRGRTSPEASLLALAELRERAAIPLALEHLEHREPAVRRAALSAASALLEPAEADGRAVEPLELTFRRAKQRRSERLQLVELLGRTGSPRAASVLVPIAERADDLDFRVAALDALATIRAPNRTPALLRALEDPEPRVRLSAALSLRKSAPPDSAQTLVHRLQRAGSQDRGALVLALAGALRGAPQGVVRQVASAAALARGPERDALIEALSHDASHASREALARFAVSRDPADRAKVAEGLAHDAEGVALTSVLLADPDVRVRANAVWSLGAIGTAAERPRIVAALGDTQAVVAANAAAALARLSARLGTSADGELCELLSDRRASVRAAAAASLRRLARRCSDGRGAALLAADRSPAVRASVAQWLRDVRPDARDLRALRRCLAHEPTGVVAAACGDLPRPLPRGASELLVFVVPAGEASPVARAAFALRRPDGLVRHGFADRRGAVCEADVADGEVSLGVPAGLEEQ